MKNFRLLFALEKSSKALYRINYFGKIDKIGKAYPGETPGRTFRKWEEVNRVFILTRHNKISSFDLVSEENMARSGSLVLTQNLIIMDYKPISRKKILVATNNYSVWLYNIKKDSKSELVTGVDFARQPELNEVVSSIAVNLETSSVIVFLKEAEKSSPSRMFLVDLIDRAHFEIKDEFWMNFSDELESASMNLNFELCFGDKQILIFFDNGGNYKINIFLVGDKQINQFFDVIGFNSGLSFVNKVEKKKLFSVDFNGIMKVLSLNV